MLLDGFVEQLLVFLLHLFEFLFKHVLHHLHLVSKHQLHLLHLTQLVAINCSFSDNNSILLYSISLNLNIRLAVLNIRTLLTH